MSRISSIAINSCLIGTGVLAWAFAGRPLLDNADLKCPLNPFGIKRSPYGEVFAMALQGPIDTRFHVGLFGAGHSHADGKDCADCAKVKAADDSTKPAEPTKTTLRAEWMKMLTSLSNVAETRTNPRGASEALKRHLRREAEDKLRFAYEMDPSQYANYNSLHFFLTEPAVGTRPELTPSAAKLAEETIQYCLKQENDPRPALTAAAAATNILHLMFTDRQNEKPKYTTTQMRDCLNLLDHCLNRYVTISKQWDETKNWDLLSPQRIHECDERFQFISKIREASATTIDRLEGKVVFPMFAN